MTDQQTSQPQPIVSSAHLAQSSMPELSEMEFALTIANNAFQRWIVRGLVAAGVADASPLDVLVLHVLHHRARPKRLADICLMLNLEDTHVVTYALKKLEKAGLVESTRKGKEKFAEVTDEGRALCERYREVRERCLLSTRSRRSPSTPRTSAASPASCARSPASTTRRPAPRRRCDRLTNGRPTCIRHPGRSASARRSGIHWPPIIDEGRSKCRLASASLISPVGHWVPAFAGKTMG